MKDAGAHPITSMLSSKLKASWLYRALRATYHFRHSQIYKRLRQQYARSDSQRIRTYLASVQTPRLHLGCGENPLLDWLNTDYFPDDPAIVHLDATQAFPLPDGSVELIFSEHMIEHLPLEGGLAMLKECFRVLKPGGRLRVETPSMERLIAIYQDPEDPDHCAYLNWHRATWLSEAPLATAATVFNDFYRNWGHLCIYDLATLTAALSEAGFEDIREQEIGISPEPAFLDLENDRRMPEGLLALHTLVMEAVKPGESA